MSRRLPGPTGSPRVLVTIVGVVAVAVGLMLLLRMAPAAEPYDPRSSAPEGARGLVQLLERQGATVTIVRDVPAPRDDTRILVLRDDLDATQLAGLDAFVRAGGVAVVADPTSVVPRPLEVAADVDGGSPVRRDLRSEIVVPRDDCDIASLEHLRGVFVQDGVLWVDERVDGSCFGSVGGGAFVVVQRLGGGDVVRIGDNDMFTNAQLDLADNAGVAAALLAPAAGASVAIVDGRGRAAEVAVSGGDGDGTSIDGTEGFDALMDRVDPTVWMVILQLALALVVFAGARAVRLGRPLVEPDAVTVEGNELVVATARLMERAGHASHAAATLQRGLHRWLCEVLHLPVASTPEEIDGVLAERGRCPAGDVREVLERSVSSAQGLERLRSDTVRVRRLAEDATVDTEGRRWTT